MKNWLKNTLIGIICLAGGVKGFSQNKEPSLGNLEFKTFQNFNPEINKKKIKIKTYDLKEFLQKESPEIKNHKEFKNSILTEAEKFGYSKKDLSNLSVHNAVELSSRITASKLDYYHEMIDKEENEMIKNNPEEYPLWLMARAFSGDTRNPEAKRVDESSPDEIFREGKGICRNYSKVNEAVFSVIKNLNKNLRNTYMEEYLPQKLEHILTLPHAWNKVSTIEDKKIISTFVDPTWLDTRGENPDTGKIISKKNLDCLNAFDEDHFYKNKYMFWQSLSNFYEKKGLPEKAIEACDSVLKNSLKEGYAKSEALAKKAKNLSNLGYSNESIETYRIWREKYSKIDSSLLDLFDLVWNALTLRENAHQNPEKKEKLLNEAIEVYELGSKIYPFRKEEFKQSISNCYFWLGEFEKGINLTNSIKDNPETGINERAEGLYFAGDQLESLGKIEEANKMYENLMKEYPSHSYSKIILEKFL